MFNEQLFTETERPILGICLGLQIFANNLSEDGKSEGLGLIDADVKEISIKNNSIISPIGWNKIEINEEITKRLKVRRHLFLFLSFL